MVGTQMYTVHIMCTRTSYLHKTGQIKYRPYTYRTNDTDMKTPSVAHSMRHDPVFNGTDADNIDDDKCRYEIMGTYKPQSACHTHSLFNTHPKHNAHVRSTFHQLEKKKKKNRGALTPDDHWSTNFTHLSAPFCDRPFVMDTLAAKCDIWREGVNRYMSL